MWNSDLTFRPQTSFFTNAPFAQPFADPFGGAPSFGVPFADDAFGFGNASISAAQMMPYLMAMIVQQQLALMYLAEMIAQGAGPNQNGGGRANGQVPQGNWSGGRRVSPSTWSGANPTQSSSSGSGSVPAPAGGPATAAEIRQIPNYNELAAPLQRAAVDAVRMGLRVTSTTGGRHTATSNHYRHNQADGMGHAIDVAGDPSRMAAFYNRYASTNPRELYYDPIGGIKRGRQIGAIGGHSNHVHLAV